MSESVSDRMTEAGIHPGYIYDGDRFRKARPTQADVDQALEQWRRMLVAVGEAFAEMVEPLRVAVATLQPIMEAQRVHQQQMHSAYDRRRRARSRRR